MIISVHIPKTAGMAFRETLNNIFGKDIFYDYGTQFSFTEPYSNSAREIFHLTKKKSKIFFRGHSGLRLSDKCIHGHFVSDKYDKLFPGSKKIVWLRDPVQRVASHYYYWLRRPDRSSVVCNYLLKNKLSLVDFANLDVMKNYQTRFLGSNSLDSFSCVGIQEHFDHSLDLMLNCLGAKSESKYVDSKINHNPNKDVSKSYDISATDASLIQEINYSDFSLYNLAVANLDLPKL
jgi:hypothetical protein